MQEDESWREFSWDGTLGGDGEAGDDAAGPVGGVGIVGTSGVDMAEVEVIVEELFVLLLVIKGAGTTDVLSVVLVDESSMLGALLVGSLSMGSIFETAAESTVETDVIKGGKTRRPFDFKISLILSCWTPM